MIPRCKYRNAEQAAHDLRDATIELVARPYSYYDPEDTIWWMVPSSEWPAYRFAKLFFVAEGEAPVLYSGLYVEKGLSPMVAETYHKRSAFAMGDGWAWPGFCDDLRNGAVSRAISRVAELSGTPLRVQIHASVSIAKASSSYDPHDHTTFENPADVVEFETHDGVLTAVRKETPGRVALPLLGISNLTDLPDAVNAIENLEWTWIDLLIGIPIQLAGGAQGEATAEDSAAVWDANALWRHGLQPWQPWLR